jgi:hypothetical protein
MFPENLIEEAATLLNVEIPILKAVLEIESSGCPFLTSNSITPMGIDVSGFPTIQFEGHVFWKYLSSLAKPESQPGAIYQNPQHFLDSSGTPLTKERLLPILYKSFSKTYTLKPIYEWDQLLLARSIDVDVANMSASWGAFQIMGFNFKQSGMPSIKEFVDKSHTIEGQFELFVNLLSNDAITCKALRRKAWTSFARRYNGPGYAANKYDTKLAAAYARLAK